MKRLYILTIASISVFSTLQAQKLKDDDAIKMNSMFTLKLETLDSIYYSFKVIKTEPFFQTVNLSESKSLFDETVEDGYIQGIFTYGKFGNRTNCFLMLKNGLGQPLNYELKIKMKSKRKPVKTSVVSLYSNVVSTELWSYDIEYLIFSNFKRAEQFRFEEDDYIFKPTIDSTCIKNPQNNQKFSDSLFVNYIDTLNYYFLSPIGLNIGKAIDFEKSINSVDVTKSHFSTVGEGIYPNKRKFKLEKPIEYRRIECPYFSTEINYYYTKPDNLVRAILFEWNVFKESNDIFAESMNAEQKDKVFREKFSKIETVMTNLLGNPTHKNIESKRAESNYRDDIKWMKANGLSAYLFMFGNNGTSYRQIRLTIYYE